MRALPHPTTATDSVGTTQSGVWALADGHQPATADLRTRAGQKPARPAESSRWAGRALDHYELEERIGQGAMGEVHAGRDRSLDRPVAIKVLRPRLAANPQLKTRFVREARAQARLRSPHVTAIYHVGSTPPSVDGSSTLYFAMEHVAGGALEAILERGERLSPERARQLLIQAARGLRDAHRAGIIHRDIKPGNLLLDDDGTLKIADFGVAKSLDELGITGKDTVIGSPYTMPPEQAAGEEIDHRSDLYSLGCTFYHLLTGSPPFDGPSAVVIAAKHVVERPRPIQRLAPGVPRSLCAIIGRMMERDPSHRYDSHDELIADLQAAAPGAIAHGGLWTRAAAAAVDAAAAGLAVSAVGWIGLVAYLAYVAAAQAWGGRTLGKYLMNLRVQQVDGRAMGVGRALARTVVSMWFPFLAAAVLLLGGGFGQLTVAVEQLQPSQLPALQALVTAAAVSHAMTFALYLAGMGIAALHPQKRAAHDLICGTRVVYEMGAPA